MNKSRSAPEEQRPPTRRAFVVVGMHRSGTSAMARVLSLLGSTLPERLMVPEAHNPAGFWEPQAVADLNDEILAAGDSEWDDVFAFRPRPYLANFDRSYLSRAVDLLDEEFKDAEVIVLKDPRISVLTSFWDRALREAGFETHYIVMIRNPLDVAESLRVRDGFPREKSLLLWSSYMAAVHRDTRNYPSTLVSYDQLMKDWRSVRDRIQQDAGFPFPRDTSAAALEIDRFLDDRLHHHRSETDLLSREDVPDLVKSLYRAFSDASRGADVDDAAVEAAQTELSKMEAVMGPLVADLRGRAHNLTRELADVRQAHAEASDRATSLAEQLDAEHKMRRSDSLAAAERIAGLQKELAGAEQTRGELQLRESELRQRQEEIEQTRTELALMSDRSRAAEAQAEAAQRIMEQEKAAREEIEAELDSAKSLREEERARAESEAKSRKQLLADHSDLKSKLERVRDELREREDDLEAAEKSIEAAGKAIEAAEKSAAESGRALSSKQRDLDERYRELAELGRALVHEEDRAHQREEEAKWLREVHVALSRNERWWFRFLPRRMQQRRRFACLRDAGLFDADSYVSNYPDVARSRQDPLRHYIAHGMHEGRQF